MPAYFKLSESAVFHNRIKTNPRTKFTIYDRKVYLNGKPQITGAFVSNVNHVPSGFVSLYQENVDRPAANLIYPYITKDGTLSSFKTISTDDFNSFGYGDILSGSYPLSASISVDRFVPGDARLPIVTLQNTLNYYKVLSPHYAYNSSHGDKASQTLALISVPSIFYGSSIKKGSLKLNFYVSGSVVARLSDVRRNGELIQDYPPGSNGSGSVAGVCLYNEGFIVLTGAWGLTNAAHTEVYSSGAEDPKWYYFASTGSAAIGMVSSSFDLQFEGVNYIETLMINCHAPKGELNHSSNPTWVKCGYPSSSFMAVTGSTYYRENDQLQVVNLNKSPHYGESGSFERITYIGSIGIYDKDRRLIAVAKLSSPVRKKETDQYTFRLKYDIQ